MTDDPINDVITALDTFEPTDYDVKNELRLDEIFADFRALPDRARAMPAIFSLLERFPDAEFGSPGTLVHELEAIAGYERLLYERLLRDSLRRQPTFRTVWMVNRILNGRLPDDQRETWLSELRMAGEHPLAGEGTRYSVEHFLEYQREKSLSEQKKGKLS
jgi:hypothetical protein